MRVIAKNPFLLKPNKTSFYNLFKNAIKKNSDEIKRNTKKLVLSSDNYEKYFKSYNKIYKTNVFQSPNKSETENTNNHLKSNSNETNQKISKKKEIILKKFNLTFFKDKKLTFQNLRTDHSSIKLISNIVFFDEIYYKLVYDEKEIFTRLNNKLNSKYQNLINERIKYLKNNENMNFTDELNKNYQNEENLFNITLKSIKITFQNITDRKKKMIKLTLPFTYLPLYYFKNFSIFRYILLSLIEFDENYENIKLNENNLISFLKHSSLFKKKSNFKHLTIKTNFSTEENEEKKEELNDLIGDIYYFIWNTKKYTFKVQIFLPQVEILFLNIKVLISLFIHRDLILFLLSINFLNWDFYILKYLIGYKKFRYYYVKNQSKIKLRISRIENFSQYIIQPKIINFIDKLNLQNTFFYFNTDENNYNSIHIIYSFKLVVKKYQKKFVFPFSFHQSKIISIISNVQNLNSFFFKILNIHKELETVTLEYPYFSFFNEKDFRKYFHKEDKNLLNNDMNNNSDNSSKKIKSSKSIILIKDLSFLKNETNDLQKSNLTMFNPIIDKKQIIMNEIENINQIYEIKIQNFYKIFDFPKEEIPQLLMKNYSSIVEIKNNEKEELNIKLRKTPQKKNINFDQEKIITYPKIKVNSGTNIHFKSPDFRSNKLSLKKK